MDFLALTKIALILQLFFSMVGIQVKILALHFFPNVSVLRKYLVISANRNLIYRWKNKFVLEKNEEKGV